MEGTGGEQLLLTLGHCLYNENLFHETPVHSIYLIYSGYPENNKKGTHSENIYQEKL